MLHYAPVYSPTAYAAAYAPPAPVVLAVPNEEHAKKAGELACRDWEERLSLEEEARKLANLQRDEFAAAHAAQVADGFAAYTKNAAEAAQAAAEAAKKAAEEAEQKAEDIGKGIAAAQEQVSKTKEATAAQEADCTAKRGVCGATEQQRREHDLSPQRFRYVPGSAPPVLPAGLPYPAAYVAPSPVYAVPDLDHTVKAIELGSRHMQEHRDAHEADVKLVSLSHDSFLAEHGVRAAEARTQCAKDAAAAARAAADAAAADADAAAGRAAAATEAAGAAHAAEAERRAATATQRSVVAARHDANASTQRERVTHACSPERVRYYEPAAAAATTTA